MATVTKRKKESKPMGKLICSHCNAVGGEMVHRTSRLFVHKDEKVCQKVDEYRTDNNVADIVVVGIEKNGAMKHHGVEIREV